MALLVSGCAHNVSYELTEKDRWQGPKIQGTVYVESFIDRSPAITNREITIGDDTWRANYRNGYANTNLTDGVTAMLVKHLQHSGLFKKVASGADTNADFILKGTLTKFETYAQVNQKAETIQAVSAGFGLIGALVNSASTAKMTSEIKTGVQFDNVKLSDKTGQIFWTDSLIITNKQDADFMSANETVVFFHCDEALKQAVTEMIKRIGNSAATNWPNTSTH